MSRQKTQSRKDIRDAYFNEKPKEFTPEEIAEEAINKYTIIELMKEKRYVSREVYDMNTGTNEKRIIPDPTCDFQYRKYIIPRVLRDKRACSYHLWPGQYTHVHMFEKPSFRTTKHDLSPSDFYDYEKRLCAEAEVPLVEITSTIAHIDNPLVNRDNSHLIDTTYTPAPNQKLVLALTDDLANLNKVLELETRAFKDIGSRFTQLRKELQKNILESCIKDSDANDTRAPHNEPFYQADGIFTRSFTKNNNTFMSPSVDQLKKYVSSIEVNQIVSFDLLFRKTYVKYLDQSFMSEILNVVRDIFYEFNSVVANYPILSNKRQELMSKLMIEQTHFMRHIQRFPARVMGAEEILSADRVDYNRLERNEVFNDVQDAIENN